MTFNPVQPNPNGLTQPMSNKNTSAIAHAHQMLSCTCSLQGSLHFCGRQVTNVY